MSSKIAHLEVAARCTRSSKACNCLIKEITFIKHDNKHPNEFKGNDQYLTLVLSPWITNLSPACEAKKEENPCYPSLLCLGACRDEACVVLGYIWTDKAGTFFGERLALALWYLQQLSYCLSSQSRFFPTCLKSFLLNVASYLLSRPLTPQLLEMGQLLLNKMGI